MSVINFASLNDLNLETAGRSIAHYSIQNPLWLSQFDKFYNDTRLLASPTRRMTELLNIVRHHGWNMNRQGQCSSILNDIRSGIITDDHLDHFWALVDNLPNVSLSKLRSFDNAEIASLTNTFSNLREILYSWHSSARTDCFLTKVVLMFNWGHTPAYDSRVCEKLGVKTFFSDRELTKSLVEIGTWISNFEMRFNIDFEEFSTYVMREESGCEFSPLPSGRAFDMMVFSLVG